MIRAHRLFSLEIREPVRRDAQHARAIGDRQREPRCVHVAQVTLDHRIDRLERRRVLCGLRGEHAIRHGKAQRDRGRGAVHEQLSSGERHSCISYGSE
jgi:hypothetical protein